MKNIQRLGKGNEFSPFKKEDKFYFGGFLNLANNNIEDFFKEIITRFGIVITDENKKPKETFGEKILNEIFKKDISIVDYEKWVNIFADYFPFTKYLSLYLEEMQFKNRVICFRDVMKELLKTVEALRNFYTHYDHEPIKIEDRVFYFLDKVLLDVSLTVKNKYLKTDKTKEFLNQHIGEELKELCKQRKDYLVGKGKRIDKESEIINGIYNNAFKDFICKREKQDDKENHNSVEKILCNKEPQNKKQKSSATVWELCSKSSSKYTEKSFPNRENDKHCLEVPISQKGIVFLLSFFLNKGEIYALTSNIKGFKAKITKEEPVTYDKNSIRYMATHRMFSFLAYKGLKRKIRTSEINYNEDGQASSTYEKETLMLQMLDELNKVPDVVYQNLSEDVQKTFIEDWNEYLKENNGDVGTMEEEQVIHPVIRKRYEDKFNYFAIRFLDEFAQFPTLRFQVHLGNYLCDKRTKQICDTTTEREVKKKITVFGRLSELENKKAIFLNEREEIKGWEVFPNPSYDFPKENISVNYKDFPIVGSILDREKQPVSNKIGIRVKIADELQREIDKAIKEKKLRNPKNRKANQDEKQKERLVNEIVSTNSNEQGEPVVFIGQPTAYLSMNDIHSVLYEFLINKISGEALETKIVEKIETQIKQIIGKDATTKILKPYTNANSNSINREKLLRDLEQEQQILKTLLEEQQQREKDKKDKKSKRKHELYPSEKGKVAVWLANDIKRFMPKAFKEQWRGYHHSLLQKYLAYYEQSKEELKNLLPKEVFKHFPFKLKGYFQQQYLNQFYTDYLKRRLSYVNELLLNIQNFKNDKDALKATEKECFKFFRKQNYIINPINIQIQSILVYPIFLKRGFLDEKPTMIDREKFKENKDTELADWFMHYKNYKEDNYQKFYAYPLEKVEEKEKFKRNKQINKQKKNDVYTLMMVEYIIQKIFGDKFVEENPLVLKGIFQSKAERQQNNTHAATTQERNLNGILNQPKDIKIQGKITVKGVKLKDIGNFRKYEIDQRVNTFLDYEPRKEWMAYLPNDWKEKEKQGQLPPNNVIDRQISKYETVRSKILLKDVQELEKIISDEIKEEHRHDLKQGKYYNFKYYILNGLLRQLKNENVENYKVFKLNTNPEKVNITQLKQEATDLEQKAFVLTYIRNKFAHNQLPKKEFWDYCQEKYGKIEKEKTYAEYFAEVFKREKEALIK
ncbi:type VI-B CRISPR-associated RNA-guided ribonuclease Cas13b [Capnocytophaga canimorsus]|uniref:Uncharacterized protein n=1 Tax=Capnocytophaga canimorsus (strain 5) TaxID=860228 RepID=F9YP87_CAPCC|nr:type VI-B CRISPR-associated RNA-guided ribonuclease Cas13b [Capnocytophaga canimorsus]AEK23281.1 Hypothetical protein Ccan_11650 [Capnocytophaga canimorsus Cc5]